MWASVTIESGEIFPYNYALVAKDNSIRLITWTLERSSLLQSGSGWHFQSLSDTTD
jgi:hypothetical protein